MIHLLVCMCVCAGVEGALDSNSRVILKGRFMAKAIESLLKRYIVEYVTCHMCRNPDTTLTRDPVTRLYFMECESCSSSRSVAPIKSGYHATNRVDRRAKKTALLTTKLA
jgi:translation initiation factor 2 subunit 2